MPTPARRVLTRARLAVVALAALIAMLAVPASAQAAAGISGVVVSGVSHSSFTVKLDAIAPGWTYRLYASTTKSDVYYANMATAPHISAGESVPTVALTSLPYISGVYWFRVQATKGTSHYTGDILSVGLQPSTPTQLVLSGSAHHGSWLTWSSSGSSGFTVQMATNSTFTAGARSFAVRGLGRQFTPYGLVSGTRYYLRIQASNAGTLSGWTSAVSVVDASRDQIVRVGTYNVLESRFDGTLESGNTVSPWSQRVVGIAAGIKSSGAAIVGIQEAADWVGPQCAYRALGTRQVDSLVDTLKSPWALAQTEVRPCLPGWARTGVYTVYDSSKYTALSTVGQWNIGTSSYPRWAVYQAFQNKVSGAQFLFVAVHTIVGNTDALDQEREDETALMISDAKAVSAAHANLPVVYAGDFNSHELHPLDGPAVAMRAAGAADALQVAQTLVNAQYNSANQYERTPPTGGYDIDHVYAAPGVAIHSFDLVMNLTSGSFVGVIPSDHNLLVSDLTIPW